METTEDMVRRLMLEFMIGSFSEATLLKSCGKLNDLVEKDPVEYINLISHQMEYIKRDLGLPNHVDVIES